MNQIDNCLPPHCVHLGRDDIYDQVRAMIEHRRKTMSDNPNTSRKFIDIVMDYGKDDKRLIETDLVDYILAGYMSTGDCKYRCIIDPLALSFNKGEI